MERIVSGITFVTARKRAMPLSAGQRNLKLEWYLFWSPVRRIIERYQQIAIHSTSIVVKAAQMPDSEGGAAITGSEVDVVTAAVQANNNYRQLCNAIMNNVYARAERFAGWRLPRAIDPAGNVAALEMLDLGDIPALIASGVPIPDIATVDGGYGTELDDASDYAIVPAVPVTTDMKQAPPRPPGLVTWPIIWRPVDRFGGIGAEYERAEP